MNKKVIKQIFLQHNLWEVSSIQKIEIGFTNEIFSINDKFILKICKKISNEENFQKEVYFYNFFKDKLKIPQIIIYDDSKKFYKRNYMIYNKIKWENLYAKRHLMNDNERKNIIKQLCDNLKIINRSSYIEYIQKFKLNPVVNWHDTIINKIKKSLKKIENKKLLSSGFITHIRAFIEINHTILNEQKIGLVYWDIHFDNILINNNQISGILDFERTELWSIDYVLNIIRKMIEYPTKYISEKFEKFAKQEDYIHLLDWFHEFYPELFAFTNLDKRLDLYALEYDLHTLLDRPTSQWVKEMIVKTVKYSN